MVAVQSAMVCLCVCPFCDVQQRVSMRGNRSGGLWEEAAKRIPLRMYKRSGAVCMGSDYEIPLASEESKVKRLYYWNRMKQEAHKCSTCVCLDAYLKSRCVP